MKMTNITSGLIGGLLSVFILLWAAHALALSADDITIDRPVVDHAGVLSASTVDEVEHSLRNHQAATGVQVAVLVVESTQGVPIEDFSMRVAEEWEGGSAERDDGVLFTLAIADRQNRIEVGYGLEAKIPDSTAAQILDSATPDLRAEDYDRATERVVEQLIIASAGGVIAVETPPHGGPPLVAIFFFLLVFALTIGLGMGATSENWLENSSSQTLPLIVIGVVGIVIPVVSGLPIIIVHPFAWLGFVVMWVIAFAGGFGLRAVIGEKIMVPTFILTCVSPGMIGVIAPFLFSDSAADQGGLELVLITPVALSAVGIMYCSMLIDGGGGGFTGSSSGFSSSGGGGGGSSSSGGGGSFGGGGASGSW